MKENFEENLEEPAVFEDIARGNGSVVEKINLIVNYFN